MTDEEKEAIAFALRQILAGYDWELREGIDWGEAGKDLADRVRDLANELEEE